MTSETTSQAAPAVPVAEFDAALPRKRMASTVLLFDESDRVLVVEPTYVDFMELPGGCVELDESPRQAAIREVKEELGLDRDPGRLLAIDWVPPRPGRSEGLIAVFDGGRLTAQEIAGIRLPADELRSYAFLPAAQAAQALPDLLARRLLSCLAARDAATTVYLENGSLTG
ncbi:NUDIX domain-containing protein [Actinoplanes sp. ATCC 53533]|uniref:NUDIX domain-containing protein n=1 Tax=Actinoplanes sp. ATCC 53533 TaxID=1288362 RepID=UPI0035136D8B